MVKKETLSLRTQINSKDLGQTVFNLVSISHKAILGILWLEKTNPSIDWHTRKITVRRENSGKYTSTQKDSYDKNLQDFVKVNEEDSIPGTQQGLHYLDKIGIRTAQCHLRNRWSISKNTQKVPGIPTNVQEKCSWETSQIQRLESQDIHWRGKETYSRPYIRPIKNWA